MMWRAKRFSESTIGLPFYNGAGYRSWATSPSQVLDRLRARFGWLTMSCVRSRALTIATAVFAAGLTHHTIFVILPLLMVGFPGWIRAVASSGAADHARGAHSHLGLRCGGTAAGRPDEFGDRCTRVGRGDRSRTAACGPGLMWHLREALSQMWAISSRSGGLAHQT